MPATTNRVGPLALPLDAGAANTPIQDPTVDGLLDYLAFWIRATLNPKLANLQGTAADAVPVANRFPWDPAAYFVRGDQDGAPGPFPALYVWWTGRSVRHQRSTLKGSRQRIMGLAWMFDELVLPGAMVDRYGLLGAVDAAIASAIDLGYHPAYGYNGAPSGTPLAVSLKLDGYGIRYAGSQKGEMAAIPGDGQGDRGAGHIVRAYPTLLATIDVYERIEPFDAADPGDVTPSILTTLRAGTEGPVENAPEIAGRYLPKPDGTEEPPTP